VSVSRRGLLGALVAAPWVVRSGVLMPVKQLVVPDRQLAKNGLFAVRYGKPTLFVLSGDTVSISGSLSNDGVYRVRSVLALNACELVDGGLDGLDSEGRTHILTDVKFG
jgi:hypothetical protein